MVVRERALELRALLCLDGIAVNVAEDLGGELERGSDGGGALPRAGLLRNPEISLWVFGTSLDAFPVLQGAASVALRRNLDGALECVLGVVCEVERGGYRRSERCDTGWAVAREDS